MVFPQVTDPLIHFPHLVFGLWKKYI